MRKRINFTIIFLLLSAIWFLIITGLINNFQFITLNQNLSLNEREDLDTQDPGFWTASGISIDDLHPNNTWYNISNSYDWCDGEGNYMNPYLIENVTFLRNSENFALSIKNSNKYFILKNCTVICGYYYGIILNNVSNGVLINNSIDGGAEEGISITHSFNNTVHNNLVKNTQYAGIDITTFSYNNNISNNVITRSLHTGIRVVYDTINNTIHDNVVFNNQQNGIWVISINNTIKDNIVYSNQKDGIRIILSDNSLIVGNVIYQNIKKGIFISSSNNCGIFNNTINNNGIELEYSNNSIISGNYLKGNKICIKEHDNCKENIFTDNTCILSRIPGFDIVILFLILLITNLICVNKLNKKVWNN